MAKLNLTVDTETYACEASVDGVAVSNIDGVSIYNWGSPDRPQYSFSLTTFELRDGVRYVTTVSAANQSRVDAQPSDLSPDLRGTTTIDFSNASSVQAINEYFAQAMKGSAK